MSPLASPTAIEAPGTSSWGGNDELTGAKGAVVRRRCARAAARRKPCATGSGSPPTAIGAASGPAGRAAGGGGVVAFRGADAQPRAGPVGGAHATRAPRI